MRLVVALLSCLCMCEWAQALADPASEPAAAQLAAPATAAPASSAATPAATTSLAPPGAAAASAPPATPPAGNGVSATDDKRLRAQGYKMTVSNGETYYCRSEPVLGTRFDHKICRTPEQLSADRNQGKDETNRAQIETKNSK